MRFKLMNYVDKTITGIVNGAWTKLSLDFTVINFIAFGATVDGPSLYFRGPGVVYLDNVMSARTWSINIGGQAEEQLHIHTVLQACYRSGGNPQTRTVP